MNEMMEVIACLGKFDQNQAMCSKVVTVQYKQCTYAIEVFHTEPLFSSVADP
jgi:hypothetical protein